MAWVSVADFMAVTRQSRSTVDRAVRADLLPSYIAADGRRLVWSAKADALAALELVRDELRELREAIAARPARVDLGADVARPAPPRAPAAPKRPMRFPSSSPSGAVDHEGILARVAASGLSDRELEAAAGLAQAWLSKARGGKRRAPRSDRQWAALAAVLEERKEGVA